MNTPVLVRIDCGNSMLIHRYVGRTRTHQARIVDQSELGIDGVIEGFRTEPPQKLAVTDPN
jgi:hypothetical protein